MFPFKLVLQVLPLFYVTLYFWILLHQPRFLTKLSIFLIPSSFLVIPPTKFDSFFTSLMSLALLSIFFFQSIFSSTRILSNGNFLWQFFFSCSTFLELANSENHNQLIIRNLENIACLILNQIMSYLVYWQYIFLKI